MPYEYCCFIGYPHGQDDVSVPVWTTSSRVLKQKSTLKPEKKVWIDYNFLMGGYKQDQ